MSSERFFAGVVVAVVVLSTGLVACAGTLDDPESFRGAGSTSLASAEAGTLPAVACVPIETGILQASCASAGCHAATSSAAHLDLASPDVLGRLSNKPATGGAGLLIAPGNPGASVLYLKITAPPFGSRMPFGARLDDATVVCVRDWIAAAR